MTRNAKKSKYLRRRGCDGEVTMGSDTDFTFNRNKGKKSPYKVFEKIVEKSVDKNKGKLLEDLEYCANMHHTLLNFSPMPQTGGMNFFKGDKRFDKIVFDLRKFFQEVKELRDESDAASKILKKHKKVSFIPMKARINKRNKIMLIEYLLKFDNVYDYCNKVYLIDEDFVDKLLWFYESVANDNMKHKAITEFWQVREYVYLAMEYWELRLKYIENNV